MRLSFTDTLAHRILRIINIVVHSLPDVVDQRGEGQKKSGRGNWQIARFTQSLD